ncbi:MAG: HEAT repeat domain-containing protein [Anaerolineales bacterium]|nr:HEAT repeat domain-containing protein [Anaerolineales bacterium]
MDGQSNKLTLVVFKYGPAWVRRSIVCQLGSRDPSVANRLLSLAIRDRNRSVRRTALKVIAASAYAWGQHRSIQVGSLLQEALGDPHPGVRTAAASALSYLLAVHFSEALESTLADDDAQVRAAAAKSLGKVGRREARDLLRRMANSDPHDDIRKIADQATEEIQRRYASPAEKKYQEKVDLIGMLLDPLCPREVQRRAKARLMGIADESLIPDLDSALKDSREDQARMDILDVLVAIPPCGQLQTTLLGYLHHALSSVRRGAIVALGNVGDKKAIFYLNEVVREGDQPEHWLTLEDSRLAREVVRKIRERTG